ncbi:MULTISPECIES: carbohydrate-binding protein [Enterococcus]|uniref:carbohydrate-binding protein n=1 Tax=Enterococcus TaxID=1350 RepID=UPI001106BF83|nr:MULTISPECIES: carbohydrate-binding protein [Enterococcus]MDB1678942.1 chitin-binding protein [Enterococcus durans]
MKKKNLLVLGIALGMFGGTIQGAAQTVMQENNTQEVASSVREWKVGTIENPELYNLNEIVSYKGKEYKVLQTHENTGNAQWNPEDAKGLFIDASEETNISFDGKLSVAVNSRNLTEVFFSIPKDSKQINDDYRIEVNNKYYFSVNKQVNYYCILYHMGSMSVYGTTARVLKIGDIVTLWYHSGPEAKKIQQIKVDASMLPK